jgi:hypothetical protein
MKTQFLPLLKLHQEQNRFTECVIAWYYQFDHCREMFLLTELEGEFT